MKLLFNSPIGLALLASISLVSPAKALVSINWTNIGNPGNAADPTYGGGAVSYVYNIGTYDVTNAQYVEFLNAKGASNSAGIYNSTMGWTGGTYTYGNYTFGNIIQSGRSGSYTYSVSSTYANNPVVGVSWFDAARFCNWLQNGQGSGDMETGAYTLNGANSSGQIILANTNALIRLPTVNEWYKAAYYNGATGTYSLYPDGRNNVTPADANYSYINGGVVNVNYGTPSSYGAYDMGGNVWQWNDYFWYEYTLPYDSTRGLRGGAWDNSCGYYSDALTPKHSLSCDPAFVSSYIGFRVVLSASGYSAWIVNYPSLSDTSPTGTPAHDGIPNLLKYVLNENPSMSSTSILPRMSKVAGNFNFSFSRLAVSTQDTTQVFQYSTDLSHWTNVMITSPTDARVALGIADINGVQIVTVTIPQGASTKMYGRLMVTQP